MGRSSGGLGAEWVIRSNRSMDIVREMSRQPSPQSAAPSSIPQAAAASQAAGDRCRSAPPRPGPTPLRIGPVVVDPPILQAPMAGFTNYAYRQVVRDFGGTGLQATEMVHARGFLEIDHRRSELPERLWGVEDEPRPLAVQIWDNDPIALADVGARLAHELKVSVVDLNFGCPVKQVTERAKSGSYLLKCPDRVGEIVERVTQACAPTPVTAKIRLGCTRDHITAAQIAQVVEQAGAAALTVHGRTAQDYFRGEANWEHIARLKENLKRIPLIGNGDLDSAEKVAQAFARWGVDGVMIARAALAKPWLFRQAAAALAGEEVPPDLTLSQQRELLLKHYRLVVERFGEKKGTVLMRKYACCYAQGKRGARDFRTHIASICTAEEFYHVLDRYFPREAVSA